MDFYRQVLAVRGYRQEILSADIANASTPGFKAVDVDFAEALKNAAAGGTGPGGGARIWLVDDARQMRPVGSQSGAAAAAADAVKYRADTNVSLDGNSVDLDKEKTAAAENAIDYEAAATFTTLTLRMLSIAINGGSGQTASGA